jgi:hypothetical protein
MKFFYEMLHEIFVTEGSISSGHNQQDFSMSGFKYQGYMLQSSGVIFCLVRSQKISYNYAAITTTNKKDTDIPISSS